MKRILVLGLSVLSTVLFAETVTCEFHYHNQSKTMSLDITPDQYIGMEDFFRMPNGNEVVAHCGKAPALEEVECGVGIRVPGCGGCFNSLGNFDLTLDQPSQRILAEDDGVKDAIEFECERR